MNFFTRAQAGSMGLKSGEYGGKNLMRTPCALAKTLSLLSLWILALSRMTMPPRFNFLNQLVTKPCVKCLSICRSKKSAETNKPAQPKGSNHGH